MWCDLVLTAWYCSRPPRRGRGRGRGTERSEGGRAAGVIQRGQRGSVCGCEMPPIDQHPPIWASGPAICRLGRPRVRLYRRHDSRPPPAARRPPPAARRPSPAVLRPPPAVLRPPPAARCPPPAARRPPSSARRPPPVSAFSCHHHLLLTPPSAAFCWCPLLLPRCYHAAILLPPAATTIRQTTTFASTARCWPGGARKLNAGFADERSWCRPVRRTGRSEKPRINVYGGREKERKRGKENRR